MITKSEMTAKENIGEMLNYIRFSTRKGENKTLIEIRTAKDCRLDAVIESVSYPFFECAYSLTAEHGEEWLLRIADLHMENVERGLYAVRCYYLMKMMRTGKWHIVNRARRRKSLWDAAFIRITGKNF
ncbi:MAG: hypothetical protein ACLTPG_03570 [Mediterraneibacter gnavus]